MIDKYWGRFNISTQEHFYHSGAHIENRHAMTEALVYNFEIGELRTPAADNAMQMRLDLAI